MSPRGAHVTRPTFLAFGSPSRVWIDTRADLIWSSILNLEQASVKQPFLCHPLSLLKWATSTKWREQGVDGGSMLWTLIQNKGAGNVWKCLQTWCWTIWNGLKWHEIIKMEDIFRLHHLKVETRSTLHVCPLQAAISFHCLLHLPWHETKWNLTSQYKSHVEVLCFICLNFDMFVCQESKLKKASSPGDAHLSAWQRAFVARANQLCLENWNIHRAQKMTALYCQLWGCNRPKSWRWADQSNFANCHLHCVGISLFLGAPPLVAHVTNACLHCVLWIKRSKFCGLLTFAASLASRSFIFSTGIRTPQERTHITL